MKNGFLPVELNVQSSAPNDVVYSVSLSLSPCSVSFPASRVSPPVSLRSSSSSLSTVVGLASVEIHCINDLSLRSFVSVLVLLLSTLFLHHRFGQLNRR